MQKPLTTFIPNTLSAVTKTEMKMKNPNMRYSGKTIYDRDGNIVRGPGFFIE